MMAGDYSYEPSHSWPWNQPFSFLDQVSRDFLPDNSQLFNQRRAMAMDVFLHMPNREAMTVKIISKNNSTREKVDSRN